MLNKIKFTLNILSVTLMTFIVMTNLAFADMAKDPSAHPSSVISQIIMVAIIFAAMYILLIRPQNKKVKEHKDLLISLNSGDEVITVGGLLGKIIKIVDNFVVLGIAQGVEVTIQKQAIAQVLPNGTLDAI